MPEQVKVSWKFGNLEMQYEGDEEFLKSGFPQLFQELLDIYKSGPKNGELKPPEIPQITESQIAENSNGGKLEYSVNTIATKLKIKGRKKLAMAACLYLALVKEKEVFSRDEILVAMKTGTHFYNANDNKGLSQYIITLINDGYLLERSQGVFAVVGTKLKEFQNTLAS